MIIIEFFIEVCKFLSFLFLRFFYWIVTARDCKHCKHGRLEYYYDGHEWECDRGIYMGYWCRNTVKREHFEKRVKSE